MGVIEMGLFGKNKKTTKSDSSGLNLKTLLSEGKIEQLQGGNMEQEDLGVELFHVVSLIETTSEKQLEELEIAIFGKTLNDCLKNGYKSSIAIKDDDGYYWTVYGKCKKS